MLKNTAAHLSPLAVQDLYVKICGVSYIGDVRMGFAEDSRKTDRIAKGSAEGLAQMYNKRLQVSGTNQQDSTSSAATRSDLMLKVKC